MKLLLAFFPSLQGQEHTIYSMFGTPVCGILADRFGRKQILVPSLLLFTITGAICAIAPTFRTFRNWDYLPKSSRN